MKAVIILSGGMDSTTLLYDIISQGYQVTALSFNYNQKHKKELEMAGITCRKLGIKHLIQDLSCLNNIAPSSLTRKEVKIPEGHYADKNMKQTVVPNRNMVMLSLAAAYCIGEDIEYLFYGAHAGDHTIYPDCRKEFVEAMQNVLTLCDWKIVKLQAPYLDINKSQILEKGMKLGVDYSLTWTCYKGEEKACGKCGSCRERLEAFEINKIGDPLKYD